MTVPAEPTEGASRTLRVAGLVAPAILLLAVLLWAVRDILSPLVAYTLLVAALWPERRDPRIARLLIVTSALVAVWLLWAAGTLLAPFVLGLAFAYLLSPAVAWLGRRRVPRWLASLLVLLPFLAALLGLLALLVPAVEHQVVQLVQQLPVLLGRLADWLDHLRTSFLASNQTLLTDEQAARLRGLQASDLVAIVQSRWQDIARGVWGGILGIGRGVSVAVTVVGFVVVTPVVTYHLLNAWDGIVAWIEGLVPPARRAAVLSFVRAYDAQLGRYVRGQLTEATLVATLTGIGLALVGFPAPLLVGVGAGLGNFIPYVGLPLSLIPGILLALTSGAIGTSLVQLVAVFAVVTFLDQVVTGPRIVGGAVGLNPLWVMIALALFGLLLGFVGLLVAVPLAVLVKLLAQRGVARYRASAYYAGTAAEAAEGG